MEIFEFIIEVLKFILYVIMALRLGKILLVFLIKKVLFLEATIEQTASFIRKTQKKYYFFSKNKNEI